MKIRIKLFGTLGNIGMPEGHISLPDNASVSDLLDALVSHYGDSFAERIKHHQVWQISINGVLHILSAARNIMLKDRDEVILLPVQFGG